MERIHIFKIKKMKTDNIVTSDVNLVRNAIKGSKEAFATLIDIYKEYLYKTAYIYVKNQHEASDIYQETVYKAFISIHKLKKPEHFKTWITKILINIANDNFRKSSKVVLMDDKEYIINCNGYENMESNIDLYNAIDSLSGKHKTAVILRYIQDISIKDVARIMDCSENTVKSYIHRALKTLKNNLMEE